MGARLRESGEGQGFEGSHAILTGHENENVGLWSIATLVQSDLEAIATERFRFHFIVKQRVGRQRLIFQA
jgi:hypothetical protein